MSSCVFCWAPATLACALCVSKPRHYCSERCADFDWRISGHVLACEGAESLMTATMAAAINETSLDATLFGAKSPRVVEDRGLKRARVISPASPDDNDVVFSPQPAARRRLVIQRGRRAPTRAIVTPASPVVVAPPPPPPPEELPASDDMDVVDVGFYNPPEPKRARVDPGSSRDVAASGNPEEAARVLSLWLLVVADFQYQMTEARAQFEAPVCVNTMTAEERDTFIDEVARVEERVTAFGEHLTRVNAAPRRLDTPEERGRIDTEIRQISDLLYETRRRLDRLCTTDAEDEGRRVVRRLLELKLARNASESNQRGLLRGLVPPIVQAWFSLPEPEWIDKQVVELVLQSGSLEPESVAASQFNLREGETFKSLVCLLRYDARDTSAESVVEAARDAMDVEGEGGVSAVVSRLVGGGAMQNARLLPENTRVPNLYFGLARRAPPSSNLSAYINSLLALLRSISNWAWWTIQNILRVAVQGFVILTRTAGAALQGAAGLFNFASRHPYLILSIVGAGILSTQFAPFTVSLLAQPLYSAASYISGLWTLTTDILKSLLPYLCGTSITSQALSYLVTATFVHQLVKRAAALELRESLRTVAEMLTLVAVNTLCAWSLSSGADATVTGQAISPAAGPGAPPVSGAVATAPLPEPGTSTMALVVRQAATERGNAVVQFGNGALATVPSRAIALLPPPPEQASLVSTVATSLGVDALPAVVTLARDTIVRRYMGRDSDALRLLPMPSEIGGDISVMEALARQAENAMINKRELAVSVLETFSQTPIGRALVVATVFASQAINAVLTRSVFADVGRGF